MDIDMATELGPINPAEAPEGWHAVEPPARFRDGVDLHGACKDCAIYRTGNRTRLCANFGPAPCLPRNRRDGRFVHFEKGPPTYGNEEDCP